MIVFKLSWLPYMFIIAGIALAAEGQPAALILVVIGAVWLYFKFKNKREANASNKPYNPNTSYNTNPSNNTNTSGAPYSTTNAPQSNHIVSSPAPTVDASQSAAKFCSNCGAKAVPGSVFCSNCGNKL